MGGEGAEAREDEAPVRKVNDLQISTDKFNRNPGVIPRLGARENAVRTSSRAESSERVDQTTQAAPDAEEGCETMEGVEELLRCNRGCRLILNTATSP